MKWLKIIIPLVFIVFVNAAAAEFYKYYDTSGNVHFTDDFNKVPENQRANVKGYDEYRQENEESTATAQDPAHQGQESKADHFTNEKAGDGKGVDFNSDLKILDQRKAELASEYESLMQENAQLASMKKTVKNKSDADRYNERVRKLNENLKEHDRKRKQFFSDVEDYNARVAQENKARTKSKSDPQ